MAYIYGRICGLKRLVSPLHMGLFQPSTSPLLPVCVTGVYAGGVATGELAPADWLP